MNLYEKIQTIRIALKELNIKKSGYNKYSDIHYYELSDILPPITDLCMKHRVFTYVTFSNDEAKLTALDMDKPEEQLFITSPMRNLELKGCNEIQALGGTETYQRRYLYMDLFDITENDMFDGQKNGGKTNTQGKKVASDSLPAKKEALIKYVGKLIDNGVDRDAMYEIVAKHNDGKKNPNTITTVAVCNAIMKDVKQFEEENR